MDGKGVMEQIGELLAAGRTSKEVIGMGYAPGSVYRVQRDMTRKARQDGMDSEHLAALDARLDMVERQAATLSLRELLLGLLVWHLDMHHLEDFHGGEEDPADRVVELTEEGYWGLRHLLRGMLGELTKHPEMRRQLGLRPQ